MEYIDNQVLHATEYADCFIHIGNQDIYEYGTKEYQREYENYIKTKQDDFKEKYESEQAKEALARLDEKTLKSFEKLSVIFSIKSIYLSKELGEIESYLNEINKEIFKNRPTQDHDNDEPTDDYIYRLVEHFRINKEKVNNAIADTKEVAAKDLLLSSK